MDEAWSPPLSLVEHGGRCRLSLVGVSYGEGDTMQAAADDLLARLATLVTALRRSGFRMPVELGPPDLRLFAFLSDLGEVVAHGEDLGARVFGLDGETGAAA